LCRLTPQFSGGALTFVTWHFIHNRPLQLLVMRRPTHFLGCHLAFLRRLVLTASLDCAGKTIFTPTSNDNAANKGATSSHA